MVKKKKKELRSEAKKYGIKIDILVVLLFWAWVLGICSGQVRADWIDDQAAGKVGWYGYEPLQKEQKEKGEKKERKEKVVLKAEKKKKTEKEEKEKWPTPQELYVMYPEEIQKWIDKAEREAIRHPTEENVYRWITYIQVAERKASEFAGMWAWVMQTHPDLYKPVAFNPVVLPGRAALTKEIKKQVITLLNAKAEDYALLVFVDDSELSKAQKQILEFFQEKYPSWRLELIDINERPKVAERLNISYAPQIWILSKKGKVVPLTAGPTALSQLEYRIFNTILVLEGVKPKEYSPFTQYILTQKNKVKKGGGL